MVLFEFQKRMIMVEKWWSFAQKGDCVCVGNTYFKHRNSQRYRRVARDQDGVEIKNMINLVVVKRAILRYVQDVRAVRGMERGLPDHHVVLCKVRLIGE